MANNLTKLKSQPKTPEQKAIRNKIRNGTYPRYMLAKDPDSADLPEREMRVVTTRGAGRKRIQVGAREKRTWRVVSTYAELTKK